MDKPYYPHLPISTNETLAKTLGVHPKLLQDFCARSNSSYTSFSVTSKSGKQRIVFEPKYELKKLQKRINHRIFEKVRFPIYLQGGIKDYEKKRDYVENAKIHANSKTLISLDIKNFYDNIGEAYVYRVFKYFFNFPDEVSKTLTALVTLNGRVPQGACTSSYIANLIFFNSEYRIVANLRGQGVKYTRLLDDITLSIESEISEEHTSQLIKDVIALFKKHDLKVQNKKTKISVKHSHAQPYDVTGLWIGHSKPKLRKSERRYIRQLVFECEKKHSQGSAEIDYHKFWNHVSGQVAKMHRLGHSQSADLRSRLAMILPTLDDLSERKLEIDLNKLINSKKQTSLKYGDITRINKVFYTLGILSRTKRNKSRKLRRKLKNAYPKIPTKVEYWL
ncbi:reverse transcriptase family protein [Marinobacter changyiensis]|uniref:reverse transcriptase family protein n=1 Tax=Marinobacter changyiensis TaxID=2604091 RepID=UPI001265A2A1|nr:reverse transcriptase family protein [Marinobacter changyiensis]